MNTETNFKQDESRLALNLHYTPPRELTAPKGKCSRAWRTASNKGEHNDIHSIITMVTIVKV